MFDRAACSLTVIALAALAGSQAAAQSGNDGAWYIQDDFEPQERVELRIHNDLDVARTNTPVIIKREDIKSLPDVHELNITVVDPSLEGREDPSPELFRVQGTHEARGETNGAWIPYQLDDLDKDGVWDELFFMTDMEPGETKTIYLYLGFQQRGWYAHETHAGIGSYMRHTVPFWESKNIGWKLWFPTDIDVYGKRAPVLMSQRLYMENLDGYGVASKNWDFGSDIMQVDRSFGGGGIGVFDDPDNNAPSRPRFTEQAQKDHGFNAGPESDTRYAFSVITNGPLRSMISAKTLNWDSGRGEYEVEQIFTAYAGESYATSRVQFSKFKPDYKKADLAVGIRKHVGETLSVQEDGIVISGAPTAIRNPDDTESLQAELNVDFIGSALVVRESDDPEYVFWPGYGENHVFRVPAGKDKAFEYLIAAGWSEGAVNQTAEEFTAYVRRVAKDFSSPVQLTSDEHEKKNKN